MQLACAASIIVITALKLHNFRVTWDDKTWNADVNNTCLLGTMSNGANLCYFAYMAGGISIIATGALSILQCCTCHLCGLVRFEELEIQHPSTCSPSQPSQLTQLNGLFRCRAGWHP